MKRNITKLIIMSCLCAFTLASCKKFTDNPVAEMPVRFYIKDAAVRDTETFAVQAQNINMIADTISMSAETNSAPLTVNCNITFKADTSKVAVYNSSHGRAQVLPSSCYTFLKATVTLPAGARQSPTGQLLFTSSQLTSGKYVLPIVIESAGGNAVQAGSVLYLVFTATEQAPISTAGWKVVSSSNHNTIYVAANVLDGNPATYWSSDGSTPMPVNAVLDMGQDFNVSAVTYLNGPYVSVGGVPTQVKIELSRDSNTWDDKGTFSGSTSTSTITLPVTPEIARYLRFTIVSSSPFYGLPFMDISEIGAIQTK